MSGELVSVVMATYNGERYLREQLDSILKQGHANFELIAVDDGSTDGTLGILQHYAARDARIRIFPAEQNVGLIANFERGLRLARGEFIVLADQDDVFREDKLAQLLSALQARPDRDLAVSDLSLIDDAGVTFAPSLWKHQKMRPRAGKPFARLVYLNFATGCAMMFRRRLLQVALPFPPDCLVHDWWLAVVAASSLAGGLVVVDEPLTAYRQHQANVLGAKAAQSLTAQKVVTRIKTPPRGRENFEARCASMRLQIARLEGYLQRDCWSAGERRRIANLRDTLLGYLGDADNGLFARLLWLPSRVRWAATTGSMTRSIAAIYVTLMPYK